MDRWFPNEFQRPLQGSDGAAFELAKSPRERRPVELWHGARKLEAWPRDPPEEPHID